MYGYGKGTGGDWEYEEILDIEGIVEHISQCSPPLMDPVLIMWLMLEIASWIKVGVRRTAEFVLKAMHHTNLISRGVFERCNHSSSF